MRQIRELIYKMDEIFLMVSIFMLEVIQKTIRPRHNHNPCFLMKKNLSPKAELASAREEMEIKVRPTPMRMAVRRSKEDLVFFGGGILE